MPKPRTAPKAKPKPRVQRAKAPVAPGKTPLKVKVVPTGPQAAELAKVASRVLSHASVQKSLGSARHRLLTVEPVEQEEGKGSRRLAAAEPVAYRATIYDYKKNQALVVNTSVDGRRSPEVVESGEQPPPTRDEFDEAVRVLSKDPDLGPQLRDEQRASVPADAAPRRSRRRHGSGRSGRSRSACCRRRRGDATRSWASISSAARSFASRTTQPTQQWRTTRSAASRTPSRTRPGGCTSPARSS